MIKSVALALVFAGAATASAAQTATRFDLVCSGTRQTGLDADPVPHDYRIRVDLEASRWCWDSCERTYEIVEVAPDRIVFQRSNEDTPRKRSTSENSVSRQTGEHHLLWIESRPAAIFIETKGQCRPAAFTPFPQTMF